MKFIKGQTVRITSVKYFGKNAEVVESFPWEGGSLAYELKPLFKCKYPKIHRHENEIENP